jgi:hypothetical protein
MAVKRASSGAGRNVAGSTYTHRLTPSTRAPAPPSASARTDTRRSAQREPAPDAQVASVSDWPYAGGRTTSNTLRRTTQPPATRMPASAVSSAATSCR